MIYSNIQEEEAIGGQNELYQIAIMSGLESRIRPITETETNERHNASQICLKLISAISRVLLIVSQSQHILDFESSIPPLIK